MEAPFCILCPLFLTGTKVRYYHKKLCGKCVQNQKKS